MSTVLTAAQRRELQHVAAQRGGVYFYADAGIYTYPRRHLEALESAGLVTIDRAKTGPWSARGWWASLTSAGRAEAGR